MLFSLMLRADCILPGQAAPTLQGQLVNPDLSFSDVTSIWKSDDYKLLLFYPRDFTFVCPTQLLAFSDAIQQFRDMAVSVIGISTDSKFAHHQWMQTSRKQGGIEGLKYPLLDDSTHSNSLNYGVLNQKDKVAMRGTFIIDSKNIIRSFSINDLSVGRGVQQILRLIKALKHADKHGVVCPANWTPGKKTIIPDVEKAKEFWTEI